MLGDPVQMAVWEEEKDGLTPLHPRPRLIVQAPSMPSLSQVFISLWLLDTVKCPLGGFVP